MGVGPKIHHQINDDSFEVRQTFKISFMNRTFFNRGSFVLLCSKLPPDLFFFIKAINRVLN